MWDVSYRDRVVDICRPFQDKAQYIKQQKQDNILNNMKLLVEVQTECLVFPAHNVTQLENVKDKPGYWDITVMKMKSNIFDNLHIDNGDKQNDDIVTLSLKPNKPEKTQKSQNNEIEKTFSLTSENHQQAFVQKEVSKDEVDSTSTTRMRDLNHSECSEQSKRFDYGQDGQAEEQNTYSRPFHDGEHQSIGRSDDSKAVSFEKHTDQEKQTCRIDKESGKESKSNKVSSSSNRDSSMQTNNKDAFENDKKKAANVDKKEVSTQQKKDNSKVKDNCLEICQNKKPTQDVGVGGSDMKENLGHQNQNEENLRTQQKNMRIETKWPEELTRPLVTFESKSETNVVDNLGETENVVCQSKNGTKIESKAIAGVSLDKNGNHKMINNREIEREMSEKSADTTKSKDSNEIKRKQSSSKSSKSGSLRGRKVICTAFL